MSYYRQGRFASLGLEGLLLMSQEVLTAPPFQGPCFTSRKHAVLELLEVAFIPFEWVCYQGLTRMRESETTGKRYPVVREATSTIVIPEGVSWQPVHYIR